MALVLGACAGDVAGIFSPRTAAPAPALSQASLPTYTAGDTFSYNDGRTERVVAVKDGGVSWATNGSLIFTTRANPILPRVTWENFARKSKLDDITGPPDALWPLKVGNRATFSYANTVIDKKSGESKSYGQVWRCKVPGTARVTVPAGTFDTFRIECVRNNLWNGWFYGRRIWNYAPTLGHYVLRRDIYSYRGAREIALMGAEPSLEKLAAVDRERMDRAVQNALETLASGTTLTWRGSDGANSGTVTPVRTFKTSTGVYCRAYRRTMALAESAGATLATACRRPDGRWKTR